MTLTKSKKLYYAITLFQEIYPASVFYLIVFIVLNVGKRWIFSAIFSFLIAKIIDIAFVQPQMQQLLNDYIKIINIALKKSTGKAPNQYQIYFCWHDGFEFLERHFDKWLNYNIVYTMKELMLMSKYNPDFLDNVQSMDQDIILENASILISALIKYPLLQKSSNCTFYNRKYAKYLQTVTLLYFDNHVILDFQNIDFDEIFKMREKSNDSWELQEFILNRFNEHLIKIK